MMQSETVANIRGIERLSKAELRALRSTAQTIGCTTDDLATVIGFETGCSFSPSQSNRAGSGAVGLIQFMPNTAHALGTTTDILSKLSFIEQLPYVAKYFSWYKEKHLDTLEKLYCAIFWPAAIDKEGDYVIGAKGGSVYRQNSGFDVQGNGDGVITRAEICSAVRKLRDDADKRERLPIDDPPVKSDPASTQPVAPQQPAVLTAPVELTQPLVKKNWCLQLFKSLSDLLFYLLKINI
jgi:hypothetical protein